MKHLVSSYYKHTFKLLIQTWQINLAKQTKRCFLINELGIITTRYLQMASRQNRSMALLRPVFWKMKKWNEHKHMIIRLFSPNVFVKDVPICSPLSFFFFQRAERWGGGRDGRIHERARCKGSGEGGWGWSTPKLKEQAGKEGRESDDKWCWQWRQVSYFQNKTQN